MLLLMRLNFQWELVFGSWFFLWGGGGGEGGRGLDFPYFPIQEDGS